MKCPYCGKTAKETEGFWLKSCVNNGEMHVYQYGTEPGKPKKETLKFMLGKGRLN